VAAVTNLVSIITPVYGASVDFLADAYASIVKQDLPDGWTWEWLVQEDGETGEVANALPIDERISDGEARRGGPGTARTIALGRSRGSLIKVLDVDDQLTPGALARDIEVLDGLPNIGWTVSGVLDLLEDGSTAPFHSDPPNGALDRGAVFEHWLSHDHHPPVHPATLCARRDLLNVLGGWMALPASEDTGLLVALSVISDGYFIAEPGMLYRIWPGQATSLPQHLDQTERDTRIAIIEARARGLAAMWP
jgi:glycosyltransferase involved in cell wall biosynthesis